MRKTGRGLNTKGEEQKGSLTQGQKNSSILITSHESQSRKARLNTKAQGHKGQRERDAWEKFKFESKFK